MPSVVSVQVGQYGNQVGQQILDLVHSEVAGDDRYFRHSRDGSSVARAVLVDMEPKAVLACMAGASEGGWAYDVARRCCRDAGSGNNWAHGYFDHGPRCWPAIRDLIQAELEASDRADGLLFYQSLAGGTGSGLGSLVTAEARDEWPELLLANQVVWPHERGDVAVQAYNCCLSLNSLADHSDGIVVLQNDVLQHVCHSVLNIPSPSHEDLNRLVAKHMASILLPSRSGGAGSLRGLVGHPLEHLCAHPAYKLLALRMAPQIPSASLGHSSNSWASVLNPLAQLAATDGFLEDRVDWTGAPLGSVSPPRSAALASWLVLRGENSERADVAHFGRHGVHAACPSTRDPLLVSAHPRRLRGLDKSAAIVTNSQALNAPLGRALNRASTLYAARAYLHQYERHGLSAEDMCIRLAGMETLCRAYEELAV